MPIFLIILFIILNIISFLVMWIDKIRAINKRWRIKESNLFLLSIIGGSLGILLGMYVFNHKTKHNKFIFGIPAIIIIQLFLIFVLR